MLPLDCLAERPVAVVGSYGSGKTEVSVNLALRLADAGLSVRIADLDLVNPYFRSREARALMERHGIRVVVPPGAQAFSDLPIVLPEVRGLFAPAPGTATILDVGGDDVGARALGSFRCAVADGGCELLQVVNSRRPFSDSVAACLAMREAIETASRFAVTGLVSNAHLVDETTPAVVLEGWRLTREVAAASALPVWFVAVMEELAGAPELAEIDAPLLTMRRRMLPPWRRGRERDDLPAARPTPLGVPGRIGHAGDSGGPDGLDRR